MKAWHAAAALALALATFTVAKSHRAGSAPAVATPAVAVPVPREQQAIARMPELKVAFRLDPALTRSLYMGERWVSPPVFDFAQPGDTFTVRAKVQSIGRDGEPGDVGGDWSTADPAMFEILPGHGDVTLRVRQPGEGDVTVTTGAGTKTLHVRAVRTADAMRVAIAQ